ncbi:MAG TPA: hypothetical protein VIV88_13170 [Gemmatimonadales bacterium]
MRCADARERMLEADRNDLAGATDSDLSRHLRGCAGCRAAADRILEVERELGRALAAAAPRRAANDAVLTATRRGVRRRWIWRSAPLAAAALLAAVLLGRHRPVERSWPSTQRPFAPADIAVEAPLGGSAAVFRTDNPDVVIIWFFRGDLP